MKWNKPVFSSSVQMVGYDDETNELVVTWKNGKQSAYADVDEGTAWSLARTASVGQMINNEIKPNYSHRYLK